MDVVGERKHIYIRLGTVGKINLSVPVSGLSSQPWVINIKDVDVLIRAKPITQVIRTSIIH